MFNLGLSFLTYDPVAQQAEHLPFKQGVRGSNPRWVTNKTGARPSGSAPVLFYPRGDRMAARGEREFSQSVDNAIRLLNCFVDKEERGISELYTTESCLLRRP